MRHSLPIMSCLLSLVCLSACSSNTGKPNTGIDYDDYIPPDEGSDAAGDPNDSSSGSKDADVARDTGTDYQDSDGDSIADNHDATDTAEAPDGDAQTSELPGTCEPGKKYCDGLDVKRCNPDGLGYQLVKSCADENNCTDDYCEDGQCLHEQNNPACCYPECGLGQICMSGECRCAPNCFGKECGDDGCGGDCGQCDNISICSDKGKCVCVPQCTDKECGDDSCGGQCGLCPANFDCIEDKCVCVPDCSGKVCGDDGCGTPCGSCNAAETCQDHQCVFTCPACPDLSGCTKLLSNYHAYYYCSSTVSFGTAENYCEERDTFLVTISSAEENVAVASLIPQGSTAWIGLSQNWLGEWKWGNGESVVFTAWGEGQPDNGGFLGGEDCAEAASWAQWNDESCNSKRAFVCEFVPAL